MAFTTKKELIGASIKRAGELAALRAELEAMTEQANAEALYSDGLRAENERLRAALSEIVSTPSAGGWVPSLQHCVDVAKEALK